MIAQTCTVVLLLRQKDVKTNLSVPINSKMIVLFAISLYYRFKLFWNIILRYLITKYDRLTLLPPNIFILILCDIYRFQ